MTAPSRISHTVINMDDANSGITSITVPSGCDGILLFAHCFNALVGAVVTSAQLDPGGGSEASFTAFGSDGGAGEIAVTGMHLWNPPIGTFDLAWARAGNATGLGAFWVVYIQGLNVEGEPIFGTPFLVGEDAGGSPHSAVVQSVDADVLVIASVANQNSGGAVNGAPGGSGQTVVDTFTGDALTMQLVTEDAPGATETTIQWIDPLNQNRGAIVVALAGTEADPDPSSRWTILRIEPHADGAWETFTVPGSVNQQWDDAVADFEALTASPAPGVLAYKLLIHATAVDDISTKNATRRAEQAAMLALIAAIKAGGGGGSLLAKPGRGNRGR